MCAELKRLQDENKSINERVIALTKQLRNAKTEFVGIKSEVSEDEHVSDEDENDEPLSEDDSSNSNSTQRSLHVRTPRHTAKQLHPPGFKEIRDRIQPFSGKQGEVDFQLWLEDNEEATTDFQ